MTTSHELAGALLQARRSGTRLDARDFDAVLQTPEDAYAVQAQVHAALDGNATPRVWKSGGPSRTATLTHAPLPAAGVVASPAPDAVLPRGTRRIEAEIALRLGRDVSPADAQACTHESATAFVEAMVPTIELVDTRWHQDVAAPALLKLADHQAHAALVVGTFVPWRAVDWSRQRCTVTVDGKDHVFTGTHSLGEPAWLLPVWLRHVTRHGATVPAGTVVTTGTWCGLMDVPEGAVVRVRFDGIGEVGLGG